MYVTYQKAPLSKRPWFISLMLLLLYPIGVFLLWKTALIKRRWKVLLTILFLPVFAFSTWFACLFIYFWNHPEITPPQQYTQTEPAPTIANTTPQETNKNDLSYGALVFGALNESPTKQEQTAPQQTQRGVDINLSAGNYIVGKDVKEGTYDIEAVEGWGMIVSDGTLGVNGAFSANEADQKIGYMQTFKNAQFKNGETLRIQGGLTARFTAR